MPSLPSLVAPITVLEARDEAVIELTRLNGQKLYLNCDLLKYAETSPDTVLTLVTGDKIVVRESCAEVIALALAERADVLRAAWPGAAAALGALLSRTHFSTAVAADCRKED
ncbi:MAG TPA: flagellar FlbD family protein [Acidobacteriaceae bacterium]|nr:flagellar FlbD family protein [Acidobacteriaceae bacterium]